MSIGQTGLTHAPWARCRRHADVSYFFRKRFHECCYETICRWDHRSDFRRLLFHGLFGAGQSEWTWRSCVESGIGWWFGYETFWLGNQVRDADMQTISETDFADNFWKGNSNEKSFDC
jgi:hypothetical protein